MEDRFRHALYAMLSAQRYPWEQGVAAQAAYENGLDEIWIPAAHDAIVRSLQDGRLAMLGSDASVADSVSAGEVCFRAWEKTGEEFFRNGAVRMLNYLKNVALRTDDGIICHSTRSFHEGFTEKQLWADAIYMMPPFFAVMGDVPEACRQINGYIRHLFDEKASLFRHIVDVGSGRFIRPVYWATGNGWALMGITRVAEEAEKQGLSEFAGKLFALAGRIILAMLPYQTEDGRFHDILDDPTSFVDGTSGLMFATGVYRNILDGTIALSLRRFADRAVLAAENHMDDMGILREVCGCPDFTDSGTSVEAQASYLMAKAWQKKVTE